MDANLQQFSEKNLFNPWTRWFLFSTIAFFAWVFVMAAFPELHNGFFYALMFPLVIAFGITALGRSGCRPDDRRIKIPKACSVLPGRYFVLLDGKLRKAESGRRSRSEMQNLIYLFDGMNIETSFIDERGVRHELNFHVNFSSYWPTIDHAAGFYHWYQELHAKMPDTDAVLEHLRQNKTPLLFRIEFPLNPTIPALNA